MKVLFVAKHNSGDNDDEGAISHALEQLGHEVIKVHELRRLRGRESIHQDADFCLFLKWATVSEIETVRCPKVFWFFDLVATSDPSLVRRSLSRKQWFNDVMPLCLMGFCTDGNWVRQWNYENQGRGLANLRWLMQGMDERKLAVLYPNQEVGKYDPNDPEIIFTGMVNHGLERVSHVERLKRRYGDRFAVIGNSGPRFRKHGTALAELFGRTKIVVSPDGPCNDLYWSNRVYLTLGLGGFLIHPRCEGLKEHYSDYELVTYGDRDECEHLIDQYLDNWAMREVFRGKGFRATAERNLYRHRCAELIRQVQEKL